MASGSSKNAVVVSNISTPHVPSQRVSSVDSYPTLLKRRPTSAGYVYAPEMMSHTSLWDADDSDDERHPEKPHRILRIYEALQDAGLLDLMQEILIRPCYPEEVLLVHSEELWDKVLAIQCKFKHPQKHQDKLTP
jgi:histone deacetylase 6